MNSYFCTFASGAQLIVKSILENKLYDVKIIKLFDGAVLFETAEPYDTFAIHCFNNVFLVIIFVKMKDSSSIEFFVKDIIDNKFNGRIFENAGKKYKTFRVIMSSQNRLVPLDNRLKAQFENRIAALSKLRLNRSGGGVEFWVAYRNEGFCFFMRRLSTHAAYEKTLKKGELHPEIAYMLNWLSEPDENDIMLDPFCGHGSIPVQRALHFPAKRIYAFDSDPAMINTVKNKNIYAKCIDIKNLDTELPPLSVDKIVTDPPWGLFKTMAMPIGELYALALSKMEKILKPGGIIVLLLGRHIDIECSIKKNPGLLLAQSHAVLVSGKKATIVTLKKMPH